MNIALNQVVNAAFAEAEATNCRIVTIEHLILALSEDYYLIDFFNVNNIELEEVIEVITEYLEKYVSEKHDVAGENIYGSVYLSALLKSLQQNNFLESSNPLSILILKEILQMKDSWTAQLLKSFGLTLSAVENYLRSRAQAGISTDVDQGVQKEFMDDYVIDLVQMAKDKKFDPLIGRDYEVARAIQVLSRRNKNNVVFIGEPGVGKSAVVSGIAGRIADDDIDEELAGSSLFYLDIGAVVAGTKYRGEFEEKLKKILAEIEDKEKPIIFIDEIHTIVNSGSSEGSSMDTANILKPYLVKGTLKCIGATTYEEYKRYFEKDKALARRFQKIEVVEPSPDEAKKILKSLIEYYESFHRVKYNENAINKAVDLSHEYIRDRFLPDKALDIIDEAGAYVKLNEIDKTVEERHVKKVITSIARIKLEETKEDEISSVYYLSDNLKKDIYGQNQAVDRIVQVVKNSKAGLTEITKPVGSFLFTGPTGVGKTELARKLAEHLGMTFTRFDMSEYMEKHAVARLIGSPPGYVGFEEGGQLVESVKRNPNAVILFDEIEKAHYDIYNILLQIMDYATLTDNSGRKADFRNCIIIMTSNAGAKEMESSKIGFAHADETGSESMAAIKNVFSPEFRNRLDGIITFNNLGIEQIKQVVRKFINEVNAMLEEKGIRLQITEDAAEYLGREGFDSKLGARPIKRLVNEKIKTRLSDEILFGRLKDGGSVLIDYENDSLNFKINDVWLN